MIEDKKNIERLFQEKFKDFEVNPPQDAWANIETRLNKKKKRRIIPFWLKAGGIAAMLTLGIGLGFYLNTNNQPLIKTVNPVVNEENENLEFDNNTIDNQNQNTNSDAVVTTNKNQNTNSELENNLNQTENNFEENRNSVVSINKNSKSKENLSDKKLVTSERNFKKEEANKKGNTTFENTVIEKQQNKAIANQTTKSEKENDSSKHNQNSFSNENENKKSNNETTNKSLLAENKTISKDSSQVASNAKAENELEKLLKEKEDGKNADEKEKEKRSKWAVSTNAAPVYFNSLTQGSSLDEQFVANEKNYETSLSYGVGLAYNISPKLKVKAGINNVALRYNTNDVYYTATLKTGQDLNANINESSNAENVLLYSRSMNSRQIISGDVENFSVQEQKGTVKQEFGYVEVPLELSYTILDKRFSIEAIGGMSTFFLTQNELSLTDNNMQMNLGKANNLNNVSYSGNFGVGLNYTFWKSFSANVQPMLKYQFNTFSEDSGNFKPYFIGVYSGISYKF